MLLSSVAESITTEMQTNEQVQLTKAVPPHISSNDILWGFQLSYNDPEFFPGVEDSDCKQWTYTKGCICLDWVRIGSSGLSVQFRVSFAGWKHMRSECEWRNASSRKKKFQIIQRLVEKVDG